MGIFDIIGFLIAGGIIGAIARFILPGDQELSWLKTIGLGVVGMILGAFVGDVITPDNTGVPWIAGIITTVVLLFGLQRTGLLAKVQSI